MIIQFTLVAVVSKSFTCFAFSKVLWLFLETPKKYNRALVARLVEHWAVMYAGACEFDSGQTITQGLKITE